MVKITELSNEVVNAHIDDLMEQVFEWVKDDELVDELRAYIQERKRRDE